MSEGWKTCLILWAWLLVAAALAGVVALFVVAVVVWGGKGWAWSALPLALLVIPPAVTALSPTLDRIEKWIDR